jgi:tetratricopeptide (TPR) repeat protein
VLRPIRDFGEMHITLVTAAYIAAALIAGTTPAGAQTLPFYDVDAETARCVTEAATGKEWTEAIRNWCQAIGKEEHVVRNELAEHWGSYDERKRKSCVADKGIADYSTLKNCLEPADTKKSQDQAKAAAEAEANQKAYLDAIRDGNAAYSAGIFDKAIANFSEAIRLHPDDASAFNSRGNAYAHKGNLYRAIADYNEAIRLKPNYASAFCNRGIARQKLNNGRDNDDKAKARQLDASACR